MTEQELFDALLENRQISTKERSAFLHPKYQNVINHDPFLLPDMHLAVDRLAKAHRDQESILVYGDYDADGVTATSLLLDAFQKFGFKTVFYQIPDRFKHGYGLSPELINDYRDKVSLIVTVDCGSLNHQAIELANQHKIDVIVTDHHNLTEPYPAAIALVNPRRSDNQYPGPILAGVGVAFNLVRALQTVLPGLESGQEKWLLDLVAIGTVTDLMELKGDNRTLVRFGIEVIKKTRRPGLRRLIAESGLELSDLNATSIAFGLGPRLNAAGRIETAELALDVMKSDDETEANLAVQRLIYLNQKRRAIQEKIFDQASLVAALDENPVLVLSNRDWHEGVVGIVASKIVERFQKPAFILQEREGILKGSARSFGGFSIYEALRRVDSLIISGGGHDVAGGVKLELENLDQFRNDINSFYESLNLDNQLQFLENQPEVWLKDFSLLTSSFYKSYMMLEPFGQSNPEPVFGLRQLKIKKIYRMGQNRQHLKMTLADKQSKSMDFVLFGDGQLFQGQIGDLIDLSFKLTLNCWQGKKSLEGRICDILS